MAATGHSSIPTAPRLSLGVDPFPSALNLDEEKRCLQTPNVNLARGGCRCFKAPSHLASSRSTFATWGRERRDGGVQRPSYSSGSTVADGDDGDPRLRLAQSGTHRVDSDGLGGRAGYIVARRVENHNRRRTVMSVETSGRIETGVAACLGTGLGFRVAGIYLSQGAVLIVWNFNGPSAD